MRPFILLRRKATETGKEKFHFVVGMGISKKASERNRIKRRLRAAVQKLGIKPKAGTEIFVRPSPEIIEKKFREITRELEGAFKQ